MNSLTLSHLDDSIKLITALKRFRFILLILTLILKLKFMQGLNKTTNKIRNKMKLAVFEILLILSIYMLLI